jgi:glycosyltransferase involved in cell wall biosynthesis
VVNWVKGRLYRNVDAMILPAPSHGEDYERWGTPRDRMFFGLNCVDNAFFADRCDRWRNESESTRREMNLPDRFLLGVGRMIEKKNWHALLKAWEARMSEVTSRGCDLVLVGDGPERGRLEEVVRSSGIRNVHFRGFEDQEGLCRYYALASGLVLPSRHGETWGLVVNEAMAAGLPILVSRECGCAQTLVEDGVNGWTFNPADVAGIGEALGKWMACTGEHLRTMGACSQRQIGAWDVTRFAREATRAAVHVAGIPARRGSYLDRVLINTWKGRYRPT